MKLAILRELGSNCLILDISYIINLVSSFCTHYCYLKKKKQECWLLFSCIINQCRELRKKKLQLMLCRGTPPSFGPAGVCTAGSPFPPSRPALTSLRYCPCKFPPHGDVRIARPCLACGCSVVRKAGRLSVCTVVLPGEGSGNPCLPLHPPSPGVPQLETN